jgi:hypothetical protein
MASSSTPAPDDYEAVLQVQVQEQQQQQQQQQLFGGGESQSSPLAAAAAAGGEEEEPVPLLGHTEAAGAAVARRSVVGSHLLRNENLSVQSAAEIALEGGSSRSVETGMGAFAHEGHHHPASAADTTRRESRYIKNAAVMIACLAALASVAEMGKSSAQNVSTPLPRESSTSMLLSDLLAFPVVITRAVCFAQRYMTENIEVSDGWAFYQAKKMRQEIYRAQVGVLEQLPDASSDETHLEIARAHDIMARMEDEPETCGDDGECEEGDGMHQIMRRTLEHERLREEALGRFEQFERVVGLLQVSIVVASVAVVTKEWWLAWLGSLVGFIAAAWGLTLAHPESWVLKRS